MAGTAGPAMFDAYVAENYDSLVASFGYAAAHGVDPYDVVHDALLIAYRKLGLEPDAFASARHLHAYVRVVGTRLVTALTAVGAAHVPLTDDDVSVTRLDPERLVVSRDALERVLNRLSLLHLKALVMVVEGSSPEQIAQALNLPNKQAANAVVYRARVEARREFEVVRHASVGAALLGLRRVSADASQVGAYASTVAGAVAFSLLTVVAAPVAPAMPRGGASGGPWRGRPALVGAAAPAPETAKPGAPIFELGRTRPAVAVAAPDTAAPRARRRPPLSPLALDTPTPGATACVPTTRRPCGQEPGDTVILLSGPSVTQAVVPVCDYVPTTPAARCTRQEPEQWIVKDVPPHSTGGATP